ncbi:LacI family DNA-binding transcriptional regulator [Ensifer sp. LCM 4579]|uniref:LacI family DNA-binding transcriptional regulator n=1 Tax=Ensifer sp. LCM 4579 TaxID=1848292 RepID=UPI0008D8F4FD|nr:LacI family DNA-binding transcriptional regulator [Ensifer sp. LCM 4579]OHV77542.1 LacI family transcriptional regulator [Ensifer sp. LCM 4579]
MTVKPLPGKRGKKSRRVRLEDIAAACGVSLSTASRALAGEKGVRPEIRQQVLEAAKIANYVIPTAVAGQKVILAASSAAMLDYVRNQFTLYVLDGLKERAQALALEIITRPIADKTEELTLLKEAKDDPEIAGLLFLTVDDEALLAATRDFEKPVVLLNGDDPFMRLSSVTPCNRSSARLAADHLMGLGHQRILFLMRPGRRTIERRYEGWRDALLHRGLPLDPDLVVPVDDWLPELATQAIVSRIEKRGLDFTAVLAAGDSLAVGAMLGIQQMGYNVPRDVSVMGMDDLPQAAFLNPPLTTMHIPMREIGSAALDLLRDSLSNLPFPPRRLELACHLVERSSTGPARV